MMEFFLYYTLVFSIIFFVSMWKLFEKEEINNIKSLIPLLNLYYYFIICEIPLWVLFIPLLNLIAFILSPYKLAKLYNLSSVNCWLAILFPYIYLPYISYSKKKRIKYLKHSNYIENKKDIDELDNRLRDNSSYEEFEDFYEKEPKTNEKTEKSILMESLENDIIIDEYDYDDTSYISETSKEKGNPKMVEILEDIAYDSMNAKNIDNIDNSFSNEKDLKSENSDYKEYKGNQLATERIAFGGENMLENQANSKVNDLKCDRCGSSLIGATDYCPGCGKQI